MVKRRIKQPFIVTTLHNNKEQTQTLWALSIEDIEKRYKKYANDLVSIKPYPMNYNISVYLPNGNELVYIDSGYSIDEVTSAAQLKNPGLKVTVVQCRHTFVI